MWSNANRQSVLIAAAIIIGSAFAGFVYYESQTPALAEDLVTIQRADASDRHIYGSSRAPITIVEFSDYECPFCSKLHPDLKRIVDESDGQIAWEYRHLPLRIHPLAVPAAIIAECVTNNIDDEAFWTFSNIVFENQPTLTEAYLRETAQSLGVTDTELQACENDPSIAKLIQADSEAAESLGGSGTPFSVIIYPDNSYKVVSGAVPYEQWLPFLNE